MLGDGGATANVAGGPLTDLKVMPTSRFESECGIKSSYAVKLTNGYVESIRQFAQGAFLDISELFLKLMQGTSNHAQASHPSMGYILHAHGLVLPAENLRDGFAAPVVL
jgi:hypothetical protein